MRIRNVVRYTDTPYLSLYTLKLDTPFFMINHSVQLYLFIHLSHRLLSVGRSVGRFVGRRKCKLMFKYISSTRPSQVSRRKANPHIFVLNGLLDRLIY